MGGMERVRRDRKGRRWRRGGESFRGRKTQRRTEGERGREEDIAVT